MKVSTLGLLGPNSYDGSVCPTGPINYFVEDRSEYLVGNPACIFVRPSINMINEFEPLFKLEVDEPLGTPTFDYGEISKFWAENSYHDFVEFLEQDGSEYVDEHFGNVGPLIYMGRLFLMSHMDPLL